MKPFFPADPDLTELGKSQAEAAHKAWVDELPSKIPLPQKFYSSPMTRAMLTHSITFKDIVAEEDRKTIVLEVRTVNDLSVVSLIFSRQNLREEYGEHTCDKRKTRSEIQSAFPSFLIEEGFTENDELWTPERESKAHAASRARAVLDRIFGNDQEQSMFYSLLLTVL